MSEDVEVGWDPWLTVPVPVATPKVLLNADVFFGGIIDHSTDSINVDFLNDS